MTMTTPNPKIVFFGTPEFAVASLDALRQSGADIAAVVTMPDKPAGRNHHMLFSDVKKYALQHELPLLQPANLKDPAFLEELQAIGADLFIVIAFRMLPRQVWQMPPMGTFNLHASLLPRYRGAAPINWAVINGDTKTGVTTFMLKHEIDTGDILSQAEIDILPTDNVGDVHDKLMELGAKEVVRTVKALAEGSAVPMPQPEGEFIPAPKIFKDTCRIDWNRPAENIHNLVRGLSPYPCAFCEIELDNGKVIQAKVLATAVSTGSGAPGEVVSAKGVIRVATAQGCIDILTLQPAGKKPMEAAAFLAGYKPTKFL